MTPQPRLPAKGLMLLAIGRKTGFAHFGTDADSYLGSLAPLLALGLVSSFWLGLREAKWRLAAVLCLRLVCVLLAPAVLADLFCRLWKRSGQWALYANLLNWSQWLAWLVFIVLLFGAQLVVSAGADPNLVIGLAGLVLFAYLGWFHWFLARQTLAVSRKRVLLLLLCSGLVSLTIAAISFRGTPQAAGTLLLNGSDK